VIVQALIIMFQGIDHCKMCLGGPAQIILQHLYAFKFKPVLQGPILIPGYARQIGLTLIHLPLQSILRPEVVGNTAIPVIDNHMILNIGAPEYRILKLAFHLWIYTSFTYLFVR